MDEMEQVITEAVHDAGDIEPAVTEAATEVTTEGTTEAAKPNPEEFHEELGVPRKRTDGRENRVPISRAETMATNRQRKALQEVGKVFGIDVPDTKTAADYDMATLIQDLTGRHQKYTTLETKAKTWDALEPIARDNPEAYIRMLAQANPEGYGRFAELLEQGKTPQQAAKQVAKENAAEEDDPEPLPDLLVDPNNPNGPKQYSVEQLQKARAWDRRGSSRRCRRW